MLNMINIRFCYFETNDKLNMQESQDRRQKIERNMVRKMFYVSEIQTKSPSYFQTKLQKFVYEVLEELQIPFERVDTDEAITMEDCVAINDKLHMHMVKTLFLCNRQQTQFYLFITAGNKPFRSKDFSNALGIARVSFAPSENMETMLGAKIGAATVFSSLLDAENKIQVVFDKEVLSEEWYGCSDGTTTGYMKVRTADIYRKFLPYTKHTAIVIRDNIILQDIDSIIEV